MTDYETTDEQREIKEWAESRNVTLICSMCQVAWVDGAPPCDCGYENIDGYWQPALAVEVPSESMNSGTQC